MGSLWPCLRPWFLSLSRDKALCVIVQGWVLGLLVSPEPGTGTQDSYYVNDWAERLHRVIFEVVDLGVRLHLYSSSVTYLLRNLRASVSPYAKWA